MQSLQFWQSLQFLQLLLLPFVPLALVCRAFSEYGGGASLCLEDAQPIIPNLMPLGRAVDEMGRRNLNGLVRGCKVGTRRKSIAARAEE
jgi:hypothetical protein